MSAIEEEILSAMNDQFIFSLSPDSAAGVTLDLIKKYVNKAIDETSGYYTDAEHVCGKSKNDFLKENGLL